MDNMIGSECALQAVSGQQWTLDPCRLPDAYSWPTWGALRERVLQACKLIKCESTSTVRDAFAAEVVNLSPADLAHWSVRISQLLGECSLLDHQQHIFNV